MGQAEHLAQVREWERIYGKPKFGIRCFNPADVRVCCAKCGKVRRHMSRHHKGAEFMFALYFPDLYAPRYIQFHKDDCIRLCSTCHKAIERITKPLKKEAREWIIYKRVRGIVPSFNEIEFFRKRIVKRCEHWLAGKRGPIPKQSSAA